MSDETTACAGCDRGLCDGSRHRADTRGVGARCEGLAPFCCNNSDCPVHGDRIDAAELDAARLVGDMAEAEVVALRARAESAEAALAGARALVTGEQIDQWRDEAARGTAVLPYASNRYVRLVDDLRALLPTPDREEARDE